MKQFKKDQLHVKIYDTRIKMGAAAAKEASTAIREMLLTKASLNIIFAAAPSQNEFLKSLREDTSIPWAKINAFHMDEYIGLSQGSPSSFSGFLDDAVFNQVPFRHVHRFVGDAKDPGTECRRYGALLQENPADIVFMGIGENGHIAFNDPGAADFHDREIIKIVELDHACRQQQVNDGCFPSLADVPSCAFTVTIPALLRAEKIFCIVPGVRKAAAVKQTLEGPISETCPASILRTKKDAFLYLDQDSAGMLG